MLLENEVSEPTAQISFDWVRGKLFNQGKCIGYGNWDSWLQASSFEYLKYILWNIASHIINFKEASH